MNIDRDYHNEKILRFPYEVPGTPLSSSGDEFSYLAAGTSYTAADEDCASGGLEEEETGSQGNDDSDSPIREEADIAISEPMFPFWLSFLLRQFSIFTLKQFASMSEEELMLMTESLSKQTPNPNLHSDRQFTLFDMFRHKAILEYSRLQQERSSTDIVPVANSNNNNNNNYRSTTSTQIAHEHLNNSDIREEDIGPQISTQVNNNSVIDQSLRAQQISTTLSQTAPEQNLTYNSTEDGEKDGSSTMFKEMKESNVKRASDDTDHDSDSSSDRSFGARRKDCVHKNHHRSQQQTDPIVSIIKVKKIEPCNFDEKLNLDNLKSSKDINSFIRKLEKHHKEQLTGKSMDALHRLNCLAVAKRYSLRSESLGKDEGSNNDRNNRLAINFGLCALITMVQNIICATEEREKHNAQKICVLCLGSGDSDVDDEDEKVTCDECGLSLHQKCVEKEISKSPHSCSTRGVKARYICSLCQSTLNLIEVCRSNKINEVQNYLLVQCASPIHTSFEAGGDSALHLAASNNFYEITSMILRGACLMKTELEIATIEEDPKFLDTSNLGWLPPLCWPKDNLNQNPYERCKTILSQTTKLPVETMLLLAFHGCGDVNDARKFIREHQTNTLRKSDGVVTINSEKTSITCVNEVGDEEEFPCGSFIYITREIESSSVSRDWFRTPLKSWEGVEIDYNLLQYPCDCNENMCKVLSQKHNIQTSSGDFMECHYNCPCFCASNKRNARQMSESNTNSHCGNRPISSGLKHKFEIFRTENNRGWGLRTLSRIEEGELVFAYAGIINTFDSACPEYDPDYFFSVHKKDGRETVVDAKEFRNLAAYVNHSCGAKANLKTRRLYSNHCDKYSFTYAFYAKEGIDENSELTFNYGPDYFNKLKKHCDTCKKSHCFCLDCLENCKGS